MVICVYLVLILSISHPRVVLQGIIHVCNIFFNDNVYNIILHVFSSWVCDLLGIMKINLSNLSNSMIVKLLHYLHYVRIHGHTIGFESDIELK